MTITVLLLFIVLLGYAPVNEEKEEEVYLKVWHFKEHKKEMLREIEIQRRLWTIRIIESGSDYYVQGGSTEIGAYQFMPGTWREKSLKYYGEILDIRSPEHQDKVAYAWVKELLLKGHNMEETASIWNCNSPVWEGKVGTNKYGRKYNVPRHVEKAMKTYAQYVYD